MFVQNKTNKTEKTENIFGKQNKPRGRVNRRLSSARNSQSAVQHTTDASFFSRKMRVFVRV